MMPSRNAVVRSPSDAVEARLDKRFDTKLALTLEHGDALVRNISASGIYFVTDVAVDIQALIRFSLDFKNLPGGPIRMNCVARVVRVEARGDKKGVAAMIENIVFQRLPRGANQR